MSSPEMDTFDISDREMHQLLNPLHRPRRQSKKHAIYGVFASDESGSDEERTGFGGRSGGSRFAQKSGNYSAPIAFVSGGVKGGNKNSDPDEEELPISDEEMGELGRPPSDSDSDASVPETEVKKTHRRQASSFRGKRRVNASGFAPPSQTSGFGAWERHTRGIGMKLLEQMGYQPGKGLGSEGQGITTPVQATQRVGKEAVGYYGSEATPAPSGVSDIAENDDSSAEPRYKKRSSKPMKNAPSYKTVEEIVASISPANPAIAVKRHGFFLENSEMSRVKVIDMTSKQQRVYTGYEAALSRVYSSTTDGKASGPDAKQNEMEKRLEGRRFDCPALRYNLSLILRSSEDDIRKRDRLLRYEEDRCVALEHEIESLSQVVKKEKFEAQSLETAIKLLTAFEAESENVGGGLEPEDIASWLDRIREQCANLPEMAVIMAAIARPMLDASLKKWKPLSDPAYCSQLMATWRDRFRNSPAFDVILETSWLGTLRRTIVNEWDPRNCEPLLEVLENWRPLLSDELFENRILDNLILPKLEEAVAAWNPLTDTIPVHTWLHPWLPWFGSTERLTAVHECVLQKLASCLSAWHPSDSSAHSILTPWRSVLPVNSLSAFLKRYIVPKLAIALQQFTLNPASQNLDCWHWVIRWVDLAGPAVIVHLLEQHFWPRWLKVLSNWLMQGVEARKRGDQVAAGQVYQEVGRWYAGWKGQIPGECIEYASVKDTLTKALAMMERAMRGLPPQEPQADRYLVPTTRPIQVPTSFPAPSHHATTLRQQIEQVALGCGYNFHPVPNRFYEGQQVYRLEQLSVFFDRNVSFVHNSSDGKWYPTSVSDLLSKVGR